MNRLATALCLALAVVALAFQPARAQRPRLAPRPYAPRVAYSQAPAPMQAPAVRQAAEDSPAAFLGLLNSARAQVGRPALAWDAGLAAYAATNAAVHMPGSSGGGSQCWAGCRSYVQAFHMWRASGPHWSILMNATTSVGVALCPTGTTANAR